MRYFAYGMNMDVAGMAHRCPKAKLLGTGLLTHTTLVFKTHASVAHAPNNPNAYVPVAIWDITSKDEVALDLLEGYPSYYRKEQMKATLPDGSTIDGMLYIMNCRRLNPPSESYYNLIANAYRNLGLEQHLGILDEAVRISNHASSRLAHFE